MPELVNLIHNLKLQVKSQTYVTSPACTESLGKQITGFANEAKVERSNSSVVLGTTGTASTLSKEEKTKKREATRKTKEKTRNK